MFKINNKNLISFTFGLLIVFATLVITIPKSANAYYNQFNCEISSFDVSRNEINSGEFVTLNWNTNNCNAVHISNIGNVNSSGIQTVRPLDTTTYVLAAYGPKGLTFYQSKTVKVSSPIIVSSTSSGSTKNVSKTSTTTSTKNTTNTTTDNSGQTTSTTNGNKTSDLAANALFGSNGFLPSSLFGWLFFAVLILIAVVLWRKLYVSDEEKKAPLKHA